MQDFGGSRSTKNCFNIIKVIRDRINKNEVEEYPVLILDDVFSELDEARQKLLVNNLSNVQMFITSAEISHKKIFDEKNVTIFNIENGDVISIENGGN